MTSVFRFGSTAVFFLIPIACLFFSVNHPLTLSGVASPKLDRCSEIQGGSFVTLLSGLIAMTAKTPNVTYFSLHLMLLTKFAPMARRNLTYFILIQAKNIQVFSRADVVGRAWGGVSLAP